MKIAAQLYTVRDYLKTPTEIEQSLRQVKEIGYQAVQVSGLGPIAPADLKRMTDAMGLTICATHVPFTSLQNDLAQVAETHQLWGCRYVGVGSMPDGYRADADGYRRFAEDANVIGRALAKEGLRLIYHNHNFEFQAFDGQIGMDILFNRFERDAVDFELDVYWVQAGGADPTEWIRKVAGRMKVVHLKDMQFVPGQGQVFAEVGQGNMNWSGIIDACQEIGVEWGAVEQDTCSGNPFDSLSLSLQNLRAYPVQI